MIGQILGHYRVLDQLGAGGMGVVYRAQDMKLGRQVAIKVLQTGNDATDEAIERFRREARTASSLNHPNICTIYGFDDHEGQCYLAMELLDGEPLDQRLSGKPLDFRTLLDIGVQIADALDAAHSEGILHRDIKPANIFITRRGQVKVLDFGLAKLTADGRRLGVNDEILETRAQHFSSVVGTTVGTIAYMSPEQARGEDLDPRTDLFSFGVVLYEMATGRQSFPGHTTAVVFDGILNREPIPASTINTAMPADLDRLIAKTLEKERTLRYQTAADMRADLQRLRRDSGTRRVAVAATSGAGLEPAPAQTVMLTASGEVMPALSAVSTASVSQPFVSHPSASAVGSYVAPTTPVPPPPAATAPSGASRASWAFAGVAVVIALVAVGAGIYVTLRPAPAAADPTAAATVPETPSETAPLPPDPLAASTAASAPTTTTPAAAPPVATPPPASTPSPQTAASGTAVKPAPTATGLAPKIAATKTAMPPTPPSAPAALPAKDVEAAQRMDVARAKLASNLVDQAVADLRQIVVDYPGTAFASDASFLAAEAFEKAGRDDDAMAAYVEFDRRFSGHPRVAESQLRRARLMQRSKVQARQTEAYALFGTIARDFPGTPHAKQALIAKRQVEQQRRQLRATDPVLNTEVPALLVTLRTISDQFPGDPEAMLALNQLAAAYDDMSRYQAEADVLERLASQFPGNPVEVWFRLGELYERRLKLADKARDAYSRVPADSPRYREAQQRLNRR
jgi:serine/threonine protein kinase/TolA-binding protein